MRGFKEKGWGGVLYLEMGKLKWETKDSNVTSLMLVWWVTSLKRAPTLVHSSGVSSYSLPSVSMTSHLPLRTRSRTAVQPVDSLLSSKDSRSSVTLSSSFLEPKPGRSVPTSVATSSCVWWVPPPTTCRVNDGTLLPS